MLETALAKLATLKVAGAAVVAAVATGGVALAAANGTLPNPLADDTAKVQPSPHATGKPTDAGNEKGKASPSPSLEGLCHAYRAGAGDNPGKALENPAFTVLITTAGGKDKVAAYCADLLGKKGKGTASSGSPTDRGDAHPTGKPDDQPAKPTSRPGDGDRPTAAPTAPRT